MEVDIAVEFRAMSAVLVGVADVSAESGIESPALAHELGVDVGGTGSVGVEEPPAGTELGVASPLVLVHDEVNYVLGRLEARVLGVFEHLDAEHVLDAHSLKVLVSGWHVVDEHAYVLAAQGFDRLRERVDAELGNLHGVEELGCRLGMALDVLAWRVLHAVLDHLLGAALNDHLVELHGRGVSTKGISRQSCGRREASQQQYRRKEYDVLHTLLTILNAKNYSLKLKKLNVIHVGEICLSTIAVPDGTNADSYKLNWRSPPKARTADGGDSWGSRAW